MNYKATTHWKRETPDFSPKTYDRTHTTAFGGGISIQGSAAPEFAGKAELANPEELFTASLANCFLLTFLYLASTKNLMIDEIKCEAVGKLGKNEEGKMAMTEVTIKPDISFTENSAVDPKVLDELFQKAHDQCFISSSVKTKVTVQSEHATT